MNSIQIFHHETRQWAVLHLLGTAGVHRGTEDAMTFGVARGSHYPTWITPGDCSRLLGRIQT